MSKTHHNSYKKASQSQPTKTKDIRREENRKERKAVRTSLKQIIEKESDEE